MQTLTIPTNVPIKQLASQENLDAFCVQYEVQEKSDNTRDETIRLAALLLETSVRGALEVKIEGIQRHYRAPIAFTKQNRLYILKFCNNERRIENSLYVISDLVSATVRELDSSWQVFGLVVYSLLQTPKEESLAKQLRVRILNEDNLINGIFS
jgi:hypothetical protein